MQAEEIRQEELTLEALLENREATQKALKKQARFQKHFTEVLIDKLNEQQQEVAQGKGKKGKKTQRLNRGMEEVDLTQEPLPGVGLIGGLLKLGVSGVSWLTRRQHLNQAQKTVSRLGDEVLLNEEGYQVFYLQTLFSRLGWELSRIYETQISQLTAGKNGVEKFAECAAERCLRSIRHSNETELDAAMLLDDIVHDREKREGHTLRCVDGTKINSNTLFRRVGIRSRGFETEADPRVYQYYLLEKDQAKLIKNHVKLDKKQAKLEKKQLSKKSKKSSQALAEEIKALAVWLEKKQAKIAQRGYRGPLFFPGPVPEMERTHEYVLSDFLPPSSLPICYPILDARLIKEYQVAKEAFDRQRVEALANEKGLSFRFNDFLSHYLGRPSIGVFYENDLTKLPDLSGLDFSQCGFINTCFNGCDLSNSLFTEGVFVDCTFEDLAEDETVRPIRLVNTCFHQADLRGCQFEVTEEALAGADFSASQLGLASLPGITFPESVNFCEATLAYLVSTGSDFTQARTNENTLFVGLPEGNVVPHVTWMDETDREQGRRLINISQEGVDTLLQISGVANVKEANKINFTEGFNGLIERLSVIATDSIQQRRETHAQTLKEITLSNPTSGIDARNSRTLRAVFLSFADAALVPPAVAIAQDLMAAGYDLQAFQLEAVGEEIELSLKVGGTLKDYERVAEIFTTHLDLEEHQSIVAERKNVAFIQLNSTQTEQLKQALAYTELHLGPSQALSLSGGMGST